MKRFIPFFGCLVILLFALGWHLDAGPPTQDHEIELIDEISTTTSAIDIATVDGTDAIVNQLPLANGEYMAAFIYNGNTTSWTATAEDVGLSHGMRSTTVTMDFAQADVNRLANVMETYGTEVNPVPIVASFSTMMQAVESVAHMYRFRTLLPAELRYIPLRQDDVGIEVALAEISRQPAYYWRI